MPTPRPSRTSAAGFTLVELTVVTFLIALFVSMASVRCRRSLDAFQQDASLRDVQSLFRLAQGRAALEQTDYGVHFAGGNAYWLVKAVDTAGDVTFIRPNSQWGMSHRLPSSMTYRDAPISVIFHWDGTASPTTLHFDAAPRAWELIVNPLNGRTGLHEVG